MKLIWPFLWKFIIFNEEGFFFALIFHVLKKGSLCSNFVLYFKERSIKLCNLNKDNTFFLNIKKLNKYPCLFNAIVSIFSIYCLV